MLELDWGPRDERGCQPAMSLDDDLMLLEFQLAYVLTTPPGGSTAHPEVKQRSPSGLVCSL